MDYSYFYIGFQFILLFQLVFGVAQVVVIKRTEYLYYAVYLFLLVIYCHAMWGNLGTGLDQFRFNPAIEPFFDKPIIILSFFMYYRFARHFLDIPKQLPLLNQQIKKIEMVLILYILVEMVLLVWRGDSELNEWVFHGISLFNLVVGIWCIVSFIRLRTTPLNYFILAGACSIILGGVTSLLLIIFQPTMQFPIIFVFPIFVLAEIVIFTTGLAYKSRLIEQQKLAAERNLVEELMANKNLQYNMMELRNKIAGDLHDDLGSTLGSLGIYADAAGKNLDIGKTEETKNILNRMYQLSTESLKNLREMVWIITPGNEKWEDLNSRMENYGKNVLAAQNIAFTIDNTVEEKLELSVLQRRNLFLIFKECVHNILKHSKAKHVQLKTEYNTIGHFVFMMEDDGVGKINDLSENGYGLKNLRTRSQELNGIFQLRNNTGSGICVVVEFPINKI